MAGHIVLHEGAETLRLLGGEWDRLATRDPSPFTTAAWLSAWWASYGSGDLVCPALHGPDGRLRAAVALRRAPLGGLTAPADDHSDDWDVVAEDEDARRELWRAVADLGPRYLTLRSLRAGISATAARDELAAAGLRVDAAPGNRSPWLELPDEPDALLASASRNLRSQVGRRRRQLEKEGELVFRTTTGGEGLDADLDELFRVEASGWKARAGTAILEEQGAERLFRSFAHAAAERGWLRVYVLEVGGRVVAADLGCAIGDQGFLIKTGFDEGWGRLSPGLVLRAEVLRASIEEGLRGYDFLGPDDDYKLRWTGTVRPRVTLRAFRGPAAVPGLAYRRAIRPALKRARALLRRGEAA